MTKLLEDCFDSAGQFEIEKGVVNGVAVFDKGSTRRFYLRKQWNDKMPAVSTLLFNPSRARAVMVDDTVSYLMRVADANRYGGLEVVNLLPGIDSDPESTELDYHFDPVNYKFIAKVVELANTVILGWGNLIPKQFRSELLSCELRQVITRHASKMRCLGLTTGGDPLHPGHLKRMGIDPTSVRLTEFDVMLLNERGYD